VSQREVKDTQLSVPAERKRKNTYTANTGPLLVTYNQAVDRTASVWSSLRWEQRREIYAVFPTAEAKGSGV